ncbi:MAG: efflux RND transporter periplasmic adaptor subunit [Elusimicrobia bacterium]|nr:efflux RND transporter periplasmic adaptor subunit [Elusimicrobiota bacterium]
MAINPALQDPDETTVSTILGSSSHRWKNRIPRVLRVRRGLLWTALLILAAGAGAFLWRKYHAKKSAPTTPSDTASVTRGDIEVHFSDSGELTPKHYVDIASKVSGRVIQLLIEEGSPVRKNQHLAVIQPGRTEAERYVPFTVTTPLAGTVMRYQKPESNEEGRIIRLGDYVTGLLDSTSPTYLMTVADLSQLVVKMKISEMDILKLKGEMSVTITVDALPGENFRGKVSLISPQADKDQNNLKTFKVEVALLKSDPRLKPGMTARVDGLLQKRPGALKIPLSAIFEEAGKPVAYRKLSKGVPQRVELQLGLRNETDAEVTGGALEGQEFATEKPAQLKKP